MQSAIRVIIVVLLTTACYGAEATSGADACTCSRFVEHALSCSMLVWKNHAADHPATVEELERLLNTLREGDQEDLRKLQSSECIRDGDDDCNEQCVGPAWERHARLLRESQDSAIHRGAVTFLFKAYTDVEEPVDFRARLEKLTRDLLGHPRDGTTTAAVLLLIAAHDIGTTDVIRLLLGELSNPDRLVRRLSYDRIAGYTGTTLPFDPEGDATLREEQATMLRRWITGHPLPALRLEPPQMDRLMSRVQSMVRDLAEETPRNRSH